MGQRLLAGWVGQARRYAWLVVLLSLAASAGCLLYTVQNIGMNADTTHLLSDKLDYKRHDLAMDEAFPGNVRGLTVVVEGPSPEAADAAAGALGERLRAAEERFDLVYFAPDDPYFQNNGLLYLSLDELADLANRLAEAQPMLAVMAEDGSLRGLAEVLDLAVNQAEGEMAGALAPVLDGLAETVEKVAAGQPAQFSWRSVMTSDPVDISDRRAFILTKPVYEYGSMEPATPALEVIHEAAGDLGLTEAEGYVIRVLGSPVLLQDELRSVSGGMGFVGLLSFALVIVLLTLGFRSWRLVVATLVTLVAGLIWTAAFATLAIGSLNLISVAFAVLFIGLSVDFGIHYSLRYREALGQPLERTVPPGSEQGAALQAAARGVGGALALSALTAAIGFLSFLPTAYKGVSELGLISGAGMFIALFANLTLLPAMLALLPEPVRHSLPPRGLGHAFQGLVEQRARTILLVALLLSLAGLATLPFARFDDDPLNLRDPDSPSMQDLLAVMEDPRVQPYEAEALAPDLAAAEELAERLEALPEVENAVTIADYVPRNQEEKLAVIDDMSLFLGPLFMPLEPAEPLDESQRRAAAGRIIALGERAEGPIEASGARLARAMTAVIDDSALLAETEEALLGSLPDHLERLARSLEADEVGLEDLPPPLVERFLAEDGKARVQITPAEDLRDHDARIRFVDAVLAVAPQTVGTPISITAGGRAVRASFLEAGLYAGVAIVLLLLVVLRNLRDTLLVLAPLVLAALLTVAASVLLGRPFNFANVIVLPLLFGLGVAFGIQIVLRARSTRSRALLETSTPRAVLFSALTTIGSFCSLSISSHPGTASMGLLLTIAIGLALFVTLLVLPSLLKVFRPGGS